MRRLDVIVLLFFPIVAALGSLAVQANLFVSTLLFFGLPALWLSLRAPKKIARSLVFSLVFSIPFVVFADYVATINQAWYVPHSILNWRLFGVIAIEDFVWGFLFVFTPIMFYEHLLDRGKHDSLTTGRFRYLLGIWLSILAIFLPLLYIRPQLLEIPYAYAVLGVAFFFLPFLAFVTKFPWLIRKLSIVAAYFFPLALLHELTGLHLNQWIFSGTEYVGWVELAGLRFPVEELFIWFIIGSATMVGYYEFFADDRR